MKAYLVTYKIPDGLVVKELYISAFRPFIPKGLNARIRKFEFNHLLLNVHQNDNIL